MFSVLIVLVAILALSSALRPTRVASKGKMQLSMKNDNKFAKFVLPAAVMPFVAPMATLAAEGTGRAFGIDDNRLVAAALLPSLVIFPLYLKWSGQQEGDDFFDGYEKRRQG